MTRRNVTWASAVAVAVVAAVATIVLVSMHHGGTSRAATVPPSPTATDGQAKSVALALRGLAADPQAFVAAGAQDEVANRAANAIPRGSSVSPDERSWAPDRLGGGAMFVTVTPPGEPAVTYAAVMVNENGAWKVLATFRLPSAHRTPSGLATS